MFSPVELDNDFKPFWRRELSGVDSVYAISDPEYRRNERFDAAGAEHFQWGRQVCGSELKRKTFGEFYVFKHALQEEANVVTF